MTTDEMWKLTLRKILQTGVETAPRDLKTKDVSSNTTVFHMRYPVLLSPARKLSYQFMAAEAVWILSGSDRVDEIAPWNKNIAKFSDDGQTFYGAYGPRILPQLKHVVEAVIRDRASRQAALTIWRENPPATKDVPCTIAMVFRCNEDRTVDNHVFMRSSDAWLGLPYDVFNFSMVAHLVCCRLNDLPVNGKHYTPGRLYLTAASSHLYEPNWGGAETCFAEATNDRDQPPTPASFYTREDVLLDTLTFLRDSKPGDPMRWWEVK